MSFEATPTQRTAFAAELGITDLCPPCPLTDGSAAAAVYLWPLLRYMQSRRVYCGILNGKYKTSVYVGLGGGGCWTEEDEPDSEGEHDEIVRLLIVALMVNGYCRDLLETLTIGMDECPLDIAREG